MRVVARAQVPVALKAHVLGLVPFAVDRPRLISGCLPVYALKLLLLLAFRAAAVLVAGAAACRGSVRAGRVAAAALAPGGIAELGVDAHVRPPAAVL
eukprot:scaffold60847_cov82-Phaeocystis_antarctica.AAC.1